MNNIGNRFPDSLFKYQNKREFKSSDITNDYSRVNQTYDLFMLDSIQRTNITDKILGNSRPYGAYFYSSQEIPRQQQSFVIYVFADDYSAFILCVLSNSGELLKYIEIAYERCDVQDVINDKEIIYCDVRYSNFQNDTTLNVIDLKITDLGYNRKEEPVIVDSITQLFDLSNDSFKQIYKDSVRLKKIK